MTGRGQLREDSAVQTTRLVRLATAAVTGTAFIAVAAMGTANAAPSVSASPFSRAADTAAAVHVSVNFTFYNPNGTNNAIPDLYFIGIDAAHAPATTFKVDWGDGTPVWTQVGGGEAVYIGPSNTPGWAVTVPKHTYAPGIYTATASVDDGTPGGAASSTAVFTAHYAQAPTAPQVSLGNAAGDAPLTVDVTVSGGTVDPTATVKNYIVNWGDGSPATTVAAPVSGGTALHHTYTVPNTYQYFSVATNDGVDSATAGGTITAYGLAMTAAVDPSGTVTATLVSGAGKPLGMTQYYLVDIDWGDGSAPSKHHTVPGFANHWYANAGSYKITATIYPTLVPDGQSASAYTWSATAAVQAPGPKASPVPAPGSRPVTRLGGDERIGTGVLVSQAHWSGWKSSYIPPGHVKAGAVVLARSDGFADALAGVPLAAHDNGPLLLTDSKVLSPAAEREISRVLQPGANKIVYLLGGPSAISPAVANRLVQLGYNVQRYAGADRFGTALDIARRGLGDPAKVVVATGADYPDALSAGPYASAVLGSPGHEAAVILSQGPVLDPATAGYLASRLAASTTAMPTVVTVGGAAGKALDAAFPAQSGHALQLAGADRYKTAAMVAARFPKASAVGVATGAGYADALTGGAFAAAQGFPILLTDPLGLNLDTRSAIAGFWSQLGQAYLFGGTSALGGQVQRDVDALLNAPSQP